MHTVASSFSWGPWLVLAFPQEKISSKMLNEVKVIENFIKRRIDSQSREQMFQKGDLQCTFVLLLYRDLRGVLRKPFINLSKQHWDCAWQLTPVTLATWEVKIEKILVQDKPDANS
jgi:hypothetical protein